jgi:hypothetical protein
MHAGFGGGGCMHLFRNGILLILFFVVLAFWLVAWAAFHVVSGGIHLLLVLAVVFLVAHFLRGRRAI